MLTTKLIRKTFGAKIEPYGFQYKGYAHRIWTFCIETGDRTQEIELQKDPGSIQLIFTFPCGMHKTGELFGDLRFHSIMYKSDEELENLLNTIGDHIVKRLIPMLPELCIPECNYFVTKEMNLKLYQEKEKLITQFLTRHQLNGFKDTDAVMRNLLQDAERVKDKPFEQVQDLLVELEAVYGTVIIQNIGGEWSELERGYITIKKLPVEISVHISYDDYLKEGGKALAFDYARMQSKYRYWVDEQYRKYGKNWRPLKPIVKTDKNLLTEEIVRETIGEKTRDMGFICRKNSLVTF